MKSVRGLAVTCVAFLLVGELLGAQVRAELKPTTVQPGEPATLTVLVEDASADAIPVIPQVPGVQVVLVGSGNQFSIVNNRVSSTASYTYRIRALKPGTYRIPPIEVRVGGRVFHTQELQFTVREPSAAQEPGMQHAADPVFLRLVVEKTNVVVGEVIEFELQFWVRRDMSVVSQPRLTGFSVDGLKLGRIVDSGARLHELDGVPYSVWCFRGTATVVQAGRVVIGPVAADLMVQIPDRRPRRNPFLDRFGDLFDFPVLEPQMVSVAVGECALSAALPPEAGRPPEFTGAVGRFQLSVSVSPTNLVAGDPVTVRVGVSGRGAFDLLDFPSPRFGGCFKSIQSTTKVQTTDALGVEGVKEFEYVIVPMSAGEWELPHMRFAFFDPVDNTYKTLDAGVVRVRVLEPEAGRYTSNNMIGVARGAEQNASPGICPMRMNLGRALAIRDTVLSRPGFYIAQPIPVLVLVIAFFYKRRMDRHRNPPQLYRLARARRRIKHELRRLERLAERGPADEFNALLFEVLQEYMAACVGRPTGSITEAVIDECIVPAGISPDTVAFLHECFKRCNAARYAGSAVAPPGRDFVHRLARAFDELGQRFEP